MYKLVKNEITSDVTGVQKQEENFIVFIPMNEANTDYQEYLKWLAEGNTPQEAK